MNMNRKSHTSTAATSASIRSDGSSQSSTTHPGTWLDVRQLSGRQWLAIGGGVAALSTISYVSWCVWTHPLCRAWREGWRRYWKMTPQQRQQELDELRGNTHDGNDQNHQQRNGDSSQKSGLPAWFTSLFHSPTSPSSPSSAVSSSSPSHSSPLIIILPLDALVDIWPIWRQLLTQSLQELWRVSSKQTAAIMTGFDDDDHGDDDTWMKKGWKDVWKELCARIDSLHASTCTPVQLVAYQTFRSHLIYHFADFLPEIRARDGAQDLLHALYDAAPSSSSSSSSASAAPISGSPDVCPSLPCISPPSTPSLHVYVISNMDERVTRLALDCIDIAVSTEIHFVFEASSSSSSSGRAASGKQQKGSRANQRDVMVLCADSAVPVDMDTLPDLSVLRHAPHFQSRNGQHQLVQLRPIPVPDLILYACHHATRQIDSAAAVASSSSTPSSHAFIQSRSMVVCTSAIEVDAARSTGCLIVRMGEDGNSTRDGDGDGARAHEAKSREFSVSNLKQLARLICQVRSATYAH